MSKRQQDALLTKQKIYNAAKTLFGERGYNNVTIDDIVGKAGVSKGSFYNHFESKENVIGSIYTEYDRLFYNAYEAVKNLSGAGKIVSFFTIYFNTMRVTVSLGLLKAIYSAQVYSKYGSQIVNDSREYHNILKLLIESVADDGLLREGLSPDDISHSLQTFIAGIEYKWCLSDGSFDLLAEAQSNLQILMKGFIAES